MNDSYNETTGELVMNPGTVLPNGCIVIAASAARAHEWTILAMRPGFHTRDRYATWRCDRPGDGLNTRWGHYFDTIDVAVRDYVRRSNA